MENKESAFILQRRPLPKKFNDEGNSKQQGGFSHHQVVKKSAKNREVTEVGSKHSCLNHGKNKSESRSPVKVKFDKQKSIECFGPSSFPQRFPLKLPWQYNKKDTCPNNKKEHYANQLYTLSVPQVDEKKHWLVEKFEQTQSKPIITNLNISNNEVHVLNLHENEQLAVIYPRKSWRQRLLEEHQADLNRMREATALPLNDDEMAIRSFEEFKSENSDAELVSRKMAALAEQLDNFDPQAHLQTKYRYDFNHLLAESTFSGYGQQQSFLKQQYDSGSIKEVNNSNTIDSQADEKGIYYCWNKNETKLNLKAYFIEFLPELPLSLFKTLVWVNLSFNDFFEFPEQLFNAKNIVYLNLRNNPLMEIPEGIKKLKNLRYLDIAFCCVSSLCESIFSLSQLEILDVSYNNLTNIPTDIKNLKHLKELYVDGNLIRFFPFSMMALKLNILNCNATFINKIFWRESIPSYPQKLKDIVQTFLARCPQFTNYVHHFPNLRIEINSKCDYCSEPMSSNGIPVIKPVAELFEHNNLPFLFHVCSPTCRNTLLLASQLPANG